MRVNIGKVQDFREIGMSNLPSSSVKVYHFLRVLGAVSSNEVWASGGMCCTVDQVAGIL